MSCAIHSAEFLGLGSSNSAVGHKISVLSEPITRTLALNDDGVVKQPIEECGGDNGSPKTSPPSAKPPFEVRQSVELYTVDQL